MTSITRHSEQSLFRTLHEIVPRSTAVGLHTHEESQLLLATSGTMQVHIDNGRWLVPPQLAVWAPAGTPHGVDTLSQVELWSIYYTQKACRRWAPGKSLDRAFALRTTPLLRELMRSLFELDALHEKAELIVRLILHELKEIPDAPTFLPLPVSVIGRRVAELALADAPAQLDIAMLARLAATSSRTISRLFPGETGLTFKAWRQRARIVTAIDRLSMGASISKTAAHTGFASTAAFAFAFRQVTGITAGHFLEMLSARS
jgi:AraC-like DNA-binding protein